jgi:hypothetical protein
MCPATVTPSNSFDPAGVKAAARVAGQPAKRVGEIADGGVGSGRRPRCADGSRGGMDGARVVHPRELGVGVCLARV